MELKDCFTSEAVREVLRTLPKTLKETYDKILDSVHERNRPHVRAALQWIACSARPLSLDELAVAAVIDPSVAKPNCSKSQLFGGGETIHNMLSKLIDVHEEERVSLDPRSKSIFEVAKYLERLGEQSQYPGPDIVKFSHSSVRDYLLQQHDYVDVSRSFSFSEDMAHRFIAKSCLAFIQDMSGTASVGSTWLGLYVARHWHTHAARLPDKEPGSLVHIFNEVPAAVPLLMMANDEYTREMFKDLVDFDSSQGKTPSPEQKLQYAACGGFSGVVDFLLAKNPDLDVNACNEFGATAPGFSCQRRHWQIANTLLKRGADPNKHDGEGVPLVDASMHGADDMVQELINHGADVNIVCDCDGESTPLSSAIEACRPSTVELLLINGANPDLDFSTSTAAKKGRHECMDILLRRGASLEPIHDFPSPLEYASASGSVETVRLLLTQGLDVLEKKSLIPLDSDAKLPNNPYSLDYPNVAVD